MEDTAKRLFGAHAFHGVDHTIERTVVTGAPDLEPGSDALAVTGGHFGAGVGVE